jgi:hypothetical protein
MNDLYPPLQLQPPQSVTRYLATKLVKQYLHLILLEEMTWPMLRCL